MKKLVVLLVTLLAITSFTGCSQDVTLYVLNWGDYISEDVVAAFEAEYGVEVIIEEVDSNESMYEKIKSGNTAYDIAVPSDYMVQRLAAENLINKLDKGQLSNLNSVSIELLVDNLMTQAEISDYAAPYFYGSIGIMYRNEYEELVKEHGFGVLFDQSILPDGIKVGMYNSSRDAVAAALLYLGYNVNTNDDAQLQEAEDLLKSMNYTIWGDDNLKREIIAGNLDIALVYSGDFFDSYYVVLEEGDELTFNYMTPLATNIWVDTMVIPSTSENNELAHQFINYFLDADNALANVEYVGYTPVVSSVYQTMLADEEWDDITGHRYFRDIYFNEDFHGQMYEHLTTDHYEKLEEILLRAKQE